MSFDVIKAVKHAALDDNTGVRIVLAGRLNAWDAFLRTNHSLRACSYRCRKWLDADTMRTRRMSVIARRSVITYDFCGLSAR
jgi:hypothetical protein